MQHATDGIADPVFCSMLPKLVASCPANYAEMYRI